jgi:hypothetical protein
VGRALVVAGVVDIAVDAAVAGPEDVQALMIRAAAASRAGIRSRGTGTR